MLFQIVFVLFMFGASDPNPKINWFNRISKTSFSRLLGIVSAASTSLEWQIIKNEKSDTHFSVVRAPISQKKIKFPVSSNCRVKAHCFHGYLWLTHSWKMAQLHQITDKISSIYSSKTGLPLHTETLRNKAGNPSHDRYGKLLSQTLRVHRISDTATERLSYQLDHHLYLFHKWKFW